MRQATLLVIRKPYQGEKVIDNLVKYSLCSYYACPDETMYSNLTESVVSELLVEEFNGLQKDYAMTDVRRAFHLILTTPNSKKMNDILDEGAYFLQNYFERQGYQALFIFHQGSDGHYFNHHYHVIVNPITIYGQVIPDNMNTYNAMVNWLKQRATKAQWRLKTKRPKEPEWFQS
jgi:hypothetical protein